MSTRAMEHQQYIVDAFTKKVFSGNPAAVCPLHEWLPDELMLSIAQENNLSETAFIVGSDGKYQIRWFTTSIEIDLCGHATLAAAFVVFEFLEPRLKRVRFDSQSGPLFVEKCGTLLSLDFPSRPGKKVDYPKILADGLNVQARETFLARDYLIVVDSEQEVSQCVPQWHILRDIQSLAIILTAPGHSCDFVSRVFIPSDSIPEDPVTGSAHCTLIPYWSKRLGKTKLHARQISKRSGDLFCEDHGDRVRISGNAALYSQATIFV